MFVVFQIICVDLALEVETVSVKSQSKCVFINIVGIYAGVLSEKIVHVYTSVTVCTHVNASVRIVSHTHTHTHTHRGNVSLLACLKNALQLFVYNKSVMNPEHEFALVVLTQEAHWVRGYPPCCQYIHCTHCMYMYSVHEDIQYKLLSPHFTYRLYRLLYQCMYTVYKYNVSSYVLLYLHF